MIFFILVSCWIGIAAGVQDDDDDEIESLKVSEGENLTISIQIKKSDEDPQVLVTRLKGGSSQERIAQMICHNGVCEHESWRSRVSLISDGQNVSLILMNLSYNQTGLYKICKLSSRHPENKIYNVTVYYEPPLSTIIPEKIASATSSEFTAGISAAVVGLALGVIIGTVIYRKHKKANSEREEIDTEAYL